MKFWKAMTTDGPWWGIMAVLFFVELIVCMGLGWIKYPELFALGFWLPSPLWYYIIVYRKEQKA